MSTRPRPAELVRLALTPKWIGLGVVLVAFIVLAGLAGGWQWNRTMEVIEAERAAQGEARAVQEVVAVGEEMPGSAVGHPVTASGTYDPDDQVLVLHRSLDGRPGVWVVTPLDLADGSRVAVVRGWLASDREPGVTPPAGSVEIAGILQPDERFYPDAKPEPGTAVAISAERLARSWDTPTLPGFVVLTEQTPAAVTDPQPVPPSVQMSDVPFPLRNFGYALQWFIFALFGVLVYLRWLWLDAVRAHEQRDASEAADTTLTA